MSEEESDGPDGWNTVDDADGGDGDAPDSDARAASGQADGLDERQRQLNKRERELEQREQEVLDRREEIVERRENLEEREQRLENHEQQLNERSRQLDEREQELDERERAIDEKRKGLQEFFDQGGANAFTGKPRVTAAFLLWVVSIAGALLAAATFLYGAAPDPPLLAAPLFSSQGATIVAGLFAAASVLELVGGFTTYYGRSWYLSVFAAIVAIVVLLPVGLTATVMITVGESGFE